MPFTVSALAPGDVIHIPNTGPNHDKARGHFFIVITPPDDNGKVLLTPISSYHDKCDKTCLFKAGDHEKIVHYSFVLYARANLYSHTHLIGQIALQKIVRSKERLKSELLKEVQDGLLRTSFAAPVYQKALVAFREIEIESSAASTPPTGD